MRARVCKVQEGVDNARHRAHAGRWTRLTHDPPDRVIQRRPQQECVLVHVGHGDDGLCEVGSDMLTPAQIHLYSIYRQSSCPRVRGMVNHCGSSHSLFAIISRLSNRISYNRTFGFEFVPGHHPLVHGHRRLQTPTKEPDIRLSLSVPLGTGPVILVSANDTEIWVQWSNLAYLHSACS